MAGNVPQGNSASQDQAKPIDTIPDYPRERRFIFVQLLFSLAAAEIARQIADLVLRRLTWEDLPAYTHLLLAIVVVATSWVGWSASGSSLRLRVVEVFGWPFVVLLLDVGLVILYFILVRGVEVPKEINGIVTLTPSARNESLTVVCIFLGYFLWDFFTKAVVPPESPVGPGTFWSRLGGGVFWRRSWISVVCALLAIVSGLYLQNVSTYCGVILADGALLMLVLLFRAMKDQRWRFAFFFGLAFLSSGLVALKLS